MTRDGFSGYFTRPLLCVLFLGFSSGLPLALTASTLTAWLFESKVDMTAIGLFASVATPYTLKFLWAPFMDSLPMPVLTRLVGRRRGWIMATQLALVASLVLMASANPEISPWSVAAIAVLVSFLSASQDIVIDAYRVDVLTPSEQGKGSAMVQLGYRLGMIASTAGAFRLAEKFGWHNTYLFMAALMGIGIVTTLLAPEPYAPADIDKSKHSFGEWFAKAVIAPFADFMRNQNWWLILLFIMIYRLADAFIGGMTNPFLLSLGFTKATIGDIVKIYGTIATLAGTFLGGALVTRMGPLRVMFIAGLLHAVTNLFYVLQAFAGANVMVLVLSTMIENVTGGIAAAAFVSYLSNLTNVHYTATQYALLSSLAALGRTWLSTPAGWVAKHLGWPAFFTASAFLAVPGLLLLMLLGRRLAFQNRQT